MGALDAIAARVAAGHTVEFRPSGSSMVPLIRNRQLVTVAPVDPARVEVGDIVLARVAGTTYLHLVSAIDAGAVVCRSATIEGASTAGPTTPGCVESVQPWTARLGLDSMAKRRTVGCPEAFVGARPEVGAR